VPTDAVRPNDEFHPRQIAALPDVREFSRQSPFAWQDGRKLWILDGCGTEWVLAELRFEPDTCRYVELRRSMYRWPREAAGALLSRTFSAGERRAREAARGLEDWLTRSRQLH
jgi:hypothetical protein